MLGDRGNGGRCWWWWVLVSGGAGLDSATQRALKAHTGHLPASGSSTSCSRKWHGSPAPTGSSTGMLYGRQLDHANYGMQ